MVAFVKINDFVEDLGEAVHDFSNPGTSAVLKLALSNTAPTAGTDATADGNGVLANITQIAYTNISGGAAAPTLDSVTWTLSGGTVTLNAADEVITASGGAIATFRYIVLYNDTPAGDPLIGYWDNGSAIDLADGESLTFDITTNILTLA